MRTHAHAYVDSSFNRAIADGPAGLGSLYSMTATRRTGSTEVMRDADDTEFHDTISIVGEPEWEIPIGVATFLCRVSGDFRQPDSGASCTGSGNAAAMFAAATIGDAGMDQDAWVFPSMAGPQVLPVFRILMVTIVFIIGMPIEIVSTLGTSSQETAHSPRPHDLDATVTLDTVLSPILVEGVADPEVLTLTDSGTKYFADTEANAQDVPLRSARLLLHHG